MNRMNKNPTLIFLSWLLLGGVAHGQHLDTLVGRFNHYRESSLQEKVYAHTDRTFYLTGETLWFKVYGVDGTLHKPLGISKVAYVEVLNAANFPVLQAKIGLEQGMGNGSFFIPASLGSGNYRLRVYTSWMKNFLPDYYFDQHITIVNPFVPRELPPRADQPACGIDFFPEGGNLVSGIRSKVGFSIRGKAGDHTTCSAVIVDDKNDTLATAAPGRSGLGSFYFTPDSNRHYTAITTHGKTGASSAQALPQVHSKGYVMHLEDKGEIIEVTVRATAVSQRSVYLFVHARQIIARAERKDLDNQTATFLLPRADLAEGISHFTLFDGSLQPVCERLFFVHPRKELQVSVSANQKVFHPRKKVTVTVETKNSKGIAGSAHVSMAVYKTDSLPQPNRKSIMPYLWLEADLAGAIESPGYYFSEESAEVRTAIDHLMLTQGWRRFDWTEVLGRRHHHAFLPEVRGHIVTGMISKGEKEQRGVFTYLGSPGKIIRAYGSWSDQEGKVRFEIKDFYGPRRIIIQAKSDSSEAYTIRLLDPFSSAWDSETLPEWRVGAENEKELVARSIAMQVQDIYYFDSFGNQVTLPKVDSSAFFGEGDATYYLDDYTRFPVMEEVMREYVPGVFVRKRKDGFHFIVLDLVNGGVLPGDPMVLLDGVPVLDVDEIMAVDPRRIRKLEVVKRQYHLGQAVFFGIVSYTSYQGDLAGMEVDPRSLSLHYEGLQLKRQFHSPQYGRQQENDRLPDQRFLLHWEPAIHTDETGKRQVEFFTSDVPGDYVVVVEGLNQDGDAGTGTLTFTVTPPENH